MRNKKKVTATTYYKRCLKIACDMAKERDNYTCQHCGQDRSSGKQMQASHVIPKSKCKHLAVNPINIKCLCSYCHRWWWHLSPAESGEWFIGKFPKRWATIKKLKEKHANSIAGGIPFWRSKWEEMKKQQRHERG